MDQMFDLGINIVNKVSNGIIKLSYDRALGEELGTIGAGGDLTKVADDFSEQIVKELINEFLKVKEDHKIILIAEETGLMIFGNEESENGFFIILDPLDGSNNLRPWKTPSPFVSISLAMGDLQNLKANKNFDAIQIGIVRDIFNGRTYYAKKGEGAFVDDFGEIQSSPLTDVKKAVIGIDFDKQEEEYNDLYPKLENLMKTKKCQRRLGTSILDMAKVACGEYDAFLTIAGRMKIHDIAAIQLITKEAGGVFDFINEEPDKCIIKEIIETKDNSLINKYRFKAVVSGNEKLHSEILKTIS